MPSYKLTYFNLRARAETIRQIFAVAGVEYEDVRIPREQWAALKGTTPFGQLPILEVDGVKVAQTTAICRFLGKSFNLAGKDLLEDVKLDMIADQANDLFMEMRPFFLVAVGFFQGDLEKLKAEVYVPTREKHFGVLKKHLAGGFILGGDRLTWADIHVAKIISALAEKVPETYEGYPEIKAFVEKVHATPKLAAYLASRPVTPY